MSNILAWLARQRSAPPPDPIGVGTDLDGRCYAVCHNCPDYGGQGIKHLAAPGSNEAGEFFARHRGHNVELIRPDPIIAALYRVFGFDLFREIEALRGGARIAEIDRLGFAGYRGNANVKEAFGTATAFTKTNANLANSATAGWQSNAIDNSSNLYLDMGVGFEFASVAWTADKAILPFTFGLIEGTAYASTGDGTASGSEGTLTYPDVTAHAVVAPSLPAIPTPVTSKAINAGPFWLASCYNNNLPVKNAIGMVNQSGATLSVTNIYYIEKYLTVV